MMIVVTIDLNEHNFSLKLTWDLLNFTDILKYIYIDFVLNFQAFLLRNTNIIINIII